MPLTNCPSEEVKRFGERVASALIDAHCQAHMNGLGGCKQYELANFEPELHPYINAYLEGGNDSTAVIYAAMRTKELEVPHHGV